MPMELLTFRPNDVPAETVWLTPWLSPKLSPVDMLLLFDTPREYVLDRLVPDDCPTVLP